MPKRSKLQRNPRVKNRMKYEKAKKRRKGAVREVRKPFYLKTIYTPPYGTYSFLCKVNENFVKKMLPVDPPSELVYSFIGLMSYCLRDFY